MEVEGKALYMSPTFMDKRGLFVRRYSVIAVTRTNVFCLFRLQEKKEWLAED